MSLEIRLRQALGDRRIAAYSVEELLPAVNTVLLQAYVLVGFTPPKSADVALLTSKLAADLQESYPFLTLRELCAKGEYGDFMGLNLRTFTRWLKTYQTSELRYRAVVERERQAQAALPTVSDIYKEEHERTYLLRVFEQYRAGYPLDRLYPARVYRSLQERGIIRNTPEEKWAAVRQAAGYQPAGNMIVSEDVRQVLVKQQAMAILLKRFFDRLIKEEKELFGKTAA